MGFFRVIFALFSLVCVFLKVHGATEEIRVDGDDFLAYKMSSIWRLGQRHVKKHTLVFDLKTVHPNGLLIYIGSGEELKDFLMLDLVHGKLRITVNLGVNIPTLGEDLVIDGNLTDNNWHTVQLTLEGRQLNVTLHEKTTHTVLKGRHARLDVNGFMYVGGLTKGIFDILQGYKPSANYKGCLRDVLYDKYRVKILTGGKKLKRKNTYREYGSPKDDCRRARFKTLSFGPPEAFLMIPSIGSVHVNVEMRFRTYFTDGVLVSKGMEEGFFPFVNVSLIGGKVFLKIRMSVHGQTIELSRGKGLNNGDWHYLSVVVNETVVRLKVDQLPELVHFNPELRQPKNKYNYVFIGYAPRSPNFVGCIHDLRVDDKQIDLLRSWDFRHGNLRNDCTLKSNCFPNPCLHCGKCNQVRSGGFSCDCEGTFHLGRLCEKPIYQRTCQEYKDLGLAENAHCKVDPDAEGPTKPFKVRCNMSDQTQMVAVVSHINAGPHQVSSASSIPSVGYYHELKYSVGMEKIKALIAQSERCRQFVNFKCYASKLLSATVDHAPVQWKGPGLGSLISDHWPGAPAGSHKCACGVNGTCANPRLPCNCDIGDKTWREDGGYVTEKHNLPITVLIFPPSTTSQSIITVGPLECFGTLTDYSSGSEETLKIQRQATRFLYTLCNVVNPTTPLPHPSVVIPDRKTPFWRYPYPTVSEKKPSSVATILKTYPETEKSTAEVSTLHPTDASPTDESVRFATPSEVTETEFSTGSNTLSEAPTTTRKVRDVQFSTREMSPDLSLNSTEALRSSDNDPDSDVQTEATDALMSLRVTWQLVVTVVLLAIVSIMIVTVLGYFVKKRRGLKCDCGILCPKKKQTLAEVYAGFPEVQLRSKSGEVDLSDVRRSIEAGSYNVRTGFIAYGDRL